MRLCESHILFLKKKKNRFEEEDSDVIPRVCQNG